MKSGQAGGDPLGRHTGERPMSVKCCVKGSLKMWALGPVLLTPALGPSATSVTASLLSPAFGAPCLPADRWWVEGSPGLHVPPSSSITQAPELNGAGPRQTAGSGRQTWSRVMQDHWFPSAWKGCGHRGIQQDMRLPPTLEGLW